MQVVAPVVTKAISIHALLAESDRRGSTRTAKLCDFYPRSPCGERPQGVFNLFANPGSISIHALLAESDGIGLVFLWWGVRFLSTLSLRRATCCFRLSNACMSISIHALLAESDAALTRGLKQLAIFLSTLSLRRATFPSAIKLLAKQISIHALLAESDLLPDSGRKPAENFYPRSPCGERPPDRKASARPWPHFYPRSPCGERLWANFSGFYWWVISIHALLAESDQRT